MPAEMIAAIVMLVSLSALFLIIPGLTRPNLFFAVTVGAEFRRTPDARRILRRFRVIVGITTLAAVSLEISTGIVLAAVIIQAAGYLWALVNAHHRALAFAVTPVSTVEVDLAAPLEHLPGGVWVTLPPIVALIGLGVWAELNWERLPQRFPVHWGFQGPDRWVAATPAAIFGFLSLHLVLCILMAASAWGVLNWSRRIATSGPRAIHERRFRRRAARLIIVAEYFVACPAYFALLQMPPAAITIWGLALAGTVVAFAINMVRSGQGGSREGTADGAPGGDHTPDACWKWGVFYVNRADPSVFIEKRFGIGYTLNFGNPWSWLVMALALAPAGLLLILLRNR